MTYKPHPAILELEERLMSDQQILSAINEIMDIIRAHYPDASLEYGFADDPVGIHATVTVDVEDTEEVSDLYLDRLIDMRFEESLPLYFVTVPPAGRSAEWVRQRLEEATRRDRVEAPSMS